MQQRRNHSTVFNVRLNDRMMEETRTIHAIQSLTRKISFSSTIRLLIQMGINQYKQDERYQDKLKLAQYKQEHDGLLPYQYDAIHADKALQIFDSIE